MRSDPSRSALYRQTSPDAPAAVFFDPNNLSEDGTAALSTYAFTESGSYFAYGVSYNGSDCTAHGVMILLLIPK